ncbi:MAG TPA: ATP-binding protein [Burkholderiaceae bacterium]
MSRSPVLQRAAPPSSTAPATIAAMREGRPRWFLWIALVVLLVAAQALLLKLTLHYRSSKAQEEVEAGVLAGAEGLRKMLGADLRRVLNLPGRDAAPQVWRERAQALLIERPELMRIERRDATFAVATALDTPVHAPLFARIPRAEAQLETELACRAAERRGEPSYSRSYFVPRPDGGGLEVIDVCIAEHAGERLTGYVVATYGLPGLLDQISASAPPPGLDLALLEPDGTMLAHGPQRSGAGVFRASRLIDLPGAALQLQLNSPATRPSLVPDLIMTVVVGLSLTLFGVVMLLARDVRRRARAESELAESLAFRKAMEDSLVTGLRARDREGRTTYVNPAFCAMVGYDADELLRTAQPPYWPAELASEYRQRQEERMASGAQTRDAFETLFVRKSGERFPAMVFESALRDPSGAHAGWMSAIVDLSAQRRVEEVARQQQDRLQATARLATIGEMASLLSHELNQPLSAIAAYATGTLNVMDAHEPGAPLDAELWDALHVAARQISQQSERAGRVIKSVHDFVRRRESAREAVSVAELVEAILPLVRLQARKSDTAIDVDLEPGLRKVVCDRAMVEQVLLNLTRNGIQAMQQREDPGDAGERRRVLVLRARASTPQWVLLSVADSGPGVADEVARRLFTPFFTTRKEGMGLGLSVCRTIVEQHGGALDFENVRDANGAVRGVEFRFTLPAERSGSAATRSAVDNSRTAATTTTN